ncbi:podoplanin isoform X1 [Neopsephotus bourkii]|uniref:podoplanin isoform X1 n=2 Tax=Neopsephotus bourkii TaxID=309878 RepID=UPI002AA537BD|nr:podoplanin isoform X1 [Neopsephotus bourkii]
MFIMIKVQFFIFVLGRVPFVALAEEASAVVEGEESATTDFRNDTELEESPTLLPTRLQSVTNLLQFGQLMTTESAFAPAEDSDNSTGYEVNTENADGGLSGEPEKTEKGGLETIALVGIIIGVIVAVGILAGIIIAVVRKMSGRYSP